MLNPNELLEALNQDVVKRLLREWIAEVVELEFRNGVAKAVREITGANAEWIEGKIKESETRQQTAVMDAIDSIAVIERDLSVLMSSTDGYEKLHERLHRGLYAKIKDIVSDETKDISEDIYGNLLKYKKEHQATHRGLWSKIKTDFMEKPKVIKKQSFIERIKKRFRL